MAKKIKKIEAMHREYGENEGAICRNCCNFDMYKFGNRRVSKCAAYGVTNSTASDWNGRYEACGMYNMSIDKTEYIPLIKKSKKLAAESCDGQIEIQEE